jgi:MFS transporter, ACS family, tartrate transporter
MPTFVQRFSNLPAATVARFVMIPALAGAVGLLLNSWSSDKSGERKWHTVIPIFCGGCFYLSISAVGRNFTVVLLLFVLYYLFTTAGFASLWAMPTTFLSRTTAAAAFGLINCIGQNRRILRPVDRGIFQ